jgi:hypothetical protein
MNFGIQATISDVEGKVLWMATAQIFKSIDINLKGHKGVHGYPSYSIGLCSVLLRFCEVAIIYRRRSCQDRRRVVNNSCS